MERSRPTYSSQLPPPASPRRVAGMMLGTLGTLVLASAFGIFAPHPLHYAARLGSPTLVRALAGIYDADATTRSGSTALHFAAREGHAEVARVLVDAGADLDGKGRGGQSALYWVARGGHVDVVRVLVEAGADVDAETQYGLTALRAAHSRNHREVVELPEQAGARQ